MGVPVDVPHARRAEDVAPYQITNIQTADGTDVAYGGHRSHCLTDFPRPCTSVTAKLHRAISGQIFFLRILPQKTPSNVLGHLGTVAEEIYTKKYVLLYLYASYTLRPRFHHMFWG